MFCNQCEGTPPPIIIEDFILNDEGIYIAKCNKGHRIASIMLAEVF